MTDTIFNEAWRSIDGYTNYQVSNVGRIRNLSTGKISKGFDNGNGYLKTVLCQGNKQEGLYIHRIVAQEFLDNPQNKLKVDHINGDIKNNSITNLRWASVSENSRNKKRNTHKSSSRYKGVYWEEGSAKWRARAMKDGKQYYVGLFRGEKDAARAYNEKALELFGEFACLNEISDSETEA